MYEPENVQFEHAVDIILEFEGGYVNDPKDPGGTTKYGITQRVYDSWMHYKKEPIASVSSITKKEAKEIYKVQYWDAIQGNLLPKYLGICLFDFAVHSGIAKAIRTLQRVIDVEPDGIMGLLTLQTIQKKDEKQIIQDLLDQRLAFLKKLSTWKIYRNGWSRRIEELRKICRYENEDDFFYRMNVSGNRLSSFSTKYVIKQDNKKAFPKNASFLKNSNFMIGSGLGVGEFLRQIYMYLEFTNYSDQILCVLTGILILVFIAYITYENFKFNREM